MTTKLQVLSGVPSFAGFGLTEYQSRPSYPTGRRAMEYLFLSMQETAPLRPSLMEVPFDSADSFIEYLDRVTPQTVWSLGDDIDLLLRDGDLVQDEVNEALLEAADKLTITGGVWDRLKSIQTIYTSLSSQATEWRLRDVWGGTKAGAGAIVEAVPTTLVEVGETAKTVAMGMKTVVKIAPYALGLLGLFIVYRYTMAPMKVSKMLAGKIK
jgi:hypothetical protein